MGNLADFVNKIAFCLAIGLMPRAAPWNQPSKVHSLVEFHEGLSQTLVCVFFRMLFVAGLAHEVIACTFHFLGPKVFHFHMSFLLLQSCFLVNPPYMIMTCISGAAPSWTWA